MKIVFHNLGQIQEATLDMRPLTVILGHNNTNKTYLAYSTYGLLDEKTRQSRVPPSLTAKLIESFGDISANGFRLPSNDVLYEFYKSVTAARSDGFRVRLNGFFQDSTKKLFEKTHFDIDIDRPAFDKGLAHITDGRKTHPLPGGTGTYKYKRIAGGFRAEVTAGGIPMPTRSIVRSAIEDIVTSLNAEFFPRPFLLPAERNALIISYKLLANRSYKVIRGFQNQIIFGKDRRPKEDRQLELMREQGHIGYPQPVEDFLDFLSDVELEQNLVNLYPDETMPFIRLAALIEERLQNKNKLSITRTRLEGKEFRINVKRGLSIDLYNASSSVKQIVPLILFLRFRARRDQLLLVDEPEMNLHPETQAKLLEVLAILTSLGIRVLVTTHSPYFMMHLNNLIQPDPLDTATKKKMAKQLYLQDERAFLDVNSVGAYVMKDNSLVSLMDTDHSVRFQTLSDVSEELHNKFFALSGIKYGRA